MNQTNASVITDGGSVMSVSSQTRLFKRFCNMLKSVHAALLRYFNESESEGDVPVGKWRFSQGQISRIVLEKITYGEIKHRVTWAPLAKDILDPCPDGELAVAGYEEVNLVRLSPAHFGFTESPTTSVLLDPKRLLDWSRENLHRQVIELCPVAVAPFLHLVNGNSYPDTILTIATAPIGKIPQLLCVAHSFYPCIVGAQANPEKTWDLGKDLVFRIREVKD